PYLFSWRSHWFDFWSPIQQLIHTFASEIGELNSEMALADRELEGQMTGVYMQSPTFADPTTPRDSGYDSLRRHMSVLDRLKQTHSVWLLLGLGDEEAVRILQSQPPGVFLVRKSAKLKRKVISLRMDSFSDAVVRDFPVKETQYNQVLEKAIQKCVLKPLKSMLVSALQDFQKKNGEWQRLEENMALAKKKSPQELGVENGCTLDPGTIEKIRQKFQAMRKMYSPEKKVDVLLQVCSLIYSTMEKSSGTSRMHTYGATSDDFLPMLTFTLAQCNMPDLDIEIQYMMELLDPFQLNGEGGYYLTSTYGAMSLIKNLQKEQETQELISETRNTLRQWHRRLTAQRSTPAIEDLQNYLRVAYLDANGIYTTKTLPVAPYSTTGDVCQLCAEKFQITGPESHGLFLVIGEGWQQLSPDSFPQSIKADIHSQRLTFSFVYRQPIPDCDPFGSLAQDKS
uniref:Ras and Rab interactor 2 n=1 Tax=Paramormyrops kingsleyae TaxID=1676925 RepID=A0A3B3RGV6_9TELE